LKKLVILALIFLTIESNAQNEFQSFINYVNSLSSTSLKNAAVDSFLVYARTKGIPFIEDSTANFIYRNNVSSVSLAGDMNGWNSTNSSLLNLAGTNFYYLSKNYEPNARLDYKYVVNGNTWILDPENPNKVSGGFGPNSELAMPEYVQPWEIIYNSAIPHGLTILKNVTSSLLNRTYQVRIYLPPDYDSANNQYPVVYFQDGSEYITLGSAVNVLDNLIHKNDIVPVIGVFVTPTNRNIEYAGGDRLLYAQFFSSELVAYIDSNYSTIKKPAKRLVLGDSFGGNISALISYLYPEVFGNCGLHSAAFWPNNYEVYGMIVNGEKKDIKYYSVWGTYESLFSNMRNFRDILIQKGYQFDWGEYPEGHSWGLWRATLDDILKFIFPKGATSVKEFYPSSTGFSLEQNYPNPFNPVTTISFTVPQDGIVTLKVYNMMGEEVGTLMNNFQTAGGYDVTFDASRLASGVYFYTLTTGILTATEKMMLLK